MLKTILNLTWKELVQLFRDRVLLAFLIAAPMLQLVLIGQSTGAGIKHERLAVWDQDQSTLSQQLIMALNNAGEFQLAYRVANYDELQALVKRGEARIAVIIPPNFARDATRADVGTTVSVIVDATSVVVASNILSAVDGAVGDLTRQYLVSRAPGRLPGGIDLKIDAEFNPTLDARWTTLPATLAFITYQLVLVIAAVSFVRERELGTMEQLAVTPLSRLELILGKGLMTALIGLANFFLLIGILVIGYRIPLRGSLVLLAGLGLFFIIAEIGVGMLLSLLSTSQQQAILIVFMLAIIEITFSGLLVPTDNMPALMQTLAYFSPLQHFTAIVRAVFLKGAELTMLTGHLIPLVLLSAFCIGAALTMFNRIEW